MGRYAKCKMEDNSITVGKRWCVVVWPMYNSRSAVDVTLLSHLRRIYYYDSNYTMNLEGKNAIIFHCRP